MGDHDDYLGGRTAYAPVVAAAAAAVVVLVLVVVVGQGGESCTQQVHSVCTTHVHVCLSMTTRATHIEEQVGV